MTSRRARPHQISCTQQKKGKEGEHAGYGLQALCQSGSRHVSFHMNQT